MRTDSFWWGRHTKIWGTNSPTVEQFIWVFHSTSSNIQVKIRIVFQQVFAFSHCFNAIFFSSNIFRYQKFTYFIFSHFFQCACVVSHLHFIHNKQCEHISENFVVLHIFTCCSMQTNILPMCMHCNVYMHSSVRHISKRNGAWSPFTIYEWELLSFIMKSLDATYAFYGIPLWIPLTLLTFSKREKIKWESSISCFYWRFCLERNG